MRAALPIVGLFCLLSSEAQAFECKVSETYDWVSLRWNRRVIQYGIREGAPANLHDIEAAFSEWSSNSCTDLAFEFTGVVDQDAAINQIVFVTEGWLQPGQGREPRPPDAVAVTVTSYTRDSGEIQNAVIEVNQERFAFTDASQDCPSGETYDLRAVVTHEVGHFIGLDHTTFYEGRPDDPTMAPQVGECETDKRSLEADDIEALCLIYPRGQPSRSCGALPHQSEYVQNTPFGCSTTTAPELHLLAFVALVVLGSRARRSGTCDEPRSGG